MPHLCRSGLTLPVYACHGDADRCTSPAATQAFVDGVASQDKVSHMWGPLQ